MFYPGNICLLTFYLTKKIETRKKMRFLKLLLFYFYLTVPYLSNFPHLYELSDEVLRYLLLVPFGDVLDDDLGFIDPAVAQQPARAVGDNRPVAADREKE